MSRQKTAILGNELLLQAARYKQRAFERWLLYCIRTFQQFRTPTPAGCPTVGVDERLAFLSLYFLFLPALQL